ncbi:Rhamnulokinase RhaK in alpha-proteobacteria [Arcticibacter svalbardensis MN12-7]|uniref:Rhamnulokinase RhaK in alpha-proteobacteria n=1 Tax=Arcticibacter svalbardensis MN12-7 TaxID=1150600 RepID=R9GU01_9SPHI|nr:Rhamnulokinase RhaK in alpha-proteobacteria [Arcticibacter svalbardensis]EOR95143.1 Rhamnulokinase RhaK in alpha-proteobacteria [Arcticibacter svalbardensis MN12-7]
MKIERYQIEEHNSKLAQLHQRKSEFLSQDLEGTENIIAKLMKFRIAIPSWALGTGGTRFARFSGGGEPRSLEEKIEDIGVLQQLNQSSGAISLHSPWDIPENIQATKVLAAQHGRRFDAMNSNTFQDQPGQKKSYKFDSMQHVDKAVRRQAIEHNIEAIKYGVDLGSESLTVWLADGSCFPGQLSFKRAFENTLESLQKVYAALPEKWKIRYAGIGLHDSSAALIPFLASFQEPFMLLSTGTWCVSLNPFNQLPLTEDELKKDCLCYISYKGNPVKASRLFAGNEHEQQTKKIS